MGIIESALALPYETRAVLCRLLVESLEAPQPKPETGNRAEELQHIMEIVTGYTIAEKCRKAEFVWCRKMIAYRMRKEGFTHADIGKQMGYDRTTIYAMLSSIQAAFDNPCFYRNEVKLWERFNNEIQRRTTCDTIAV